MKHYKLVKCSRPGWEFLTSHIDLVHNMLSHGIGSCCRTDPETINEVCPNGLSKRAEIDLWLDTECGLEYDFQEWDSYEEYKKEVLK